MEKSVSVIIIVQGRKQHLKNVIRGLSAVTLPPATELEVVIVHMNESASVKPDNFPHRFLSCSINCHHNLPLARARNYGAKLASSEHLIFLDVDCIPHTELITDYVNALEDHPKSIFMGEVYYLPAPLHKNWDMETLAELGDKHPKRTYIEGKKKYLREIAYERFWSLNFAINKTTFKLLGGFDEGFTGYGAEDTDFIMTAKLYDIPLYWVNGATSYHQYHGEQGSVPLQHFDDIIRNAETYHGKWKTWPMESWLNAFSEMGYILWMPHLPHIQVLHSPSLPKDRAA